MRIGQGYDVHRLTEGRRLILGGVDIPYKLGLLGHSDADVLAHAIMDALLGAAKGTVTAGKRLLVENHRGVLSYGDAQIIVRLPRGKLSVSGSALSLLVMTSEQLLIGGRIQTLEWE